MAESVKNSGKIEIPTAKVERDLIYIDDIVEAVRKAIDRGKSGFRVLNITSGERRTLERLAATIVRISNKSATVAKVSRAVHPAIVHASIAKARKELDWRPKFNLEDGLRKTLASYGLWIQHA